MNDKSVKEEYTSLALADASTRKRKGAQLTVVNTSVQLWGSTALGFNGIGGCAMCYGQTDIVKSGRKLLVYFNGRFAYDIDTNTLSPEQKSNLKNHEKTGEWPHQRSASSIGGRLDSSASDF